MVKIPADTSDAGSFGIAVDLTADGSTAIVGAAQHNYDRGGAYIFQRAGTSWSETADLTLPGLGYQASYGNAVAISGDGSLAMVSEVGWRQLTGVVFIFAKTATGWTTIGQLTAPDQATYSHFGDSISMDAAGNRVVIGSLGAGGFAGRAYVFSRGSGGHWSLTAELAPPASQGQTDFGTSVSMDSTGSAVLIGGDVLANGVGAAYVFGDTGGSWQQQAMLMAGQPQLDANFGVSVALDGAGTTAVVGAVYEDNGAGAAYVFQAGRNGWTRTARLAQPGTGQFGDAVAINQAGSVAVVGAEATLTPGRAYVYSSTATGWAPSMTLGPNVTSQALFGVAVAMDTTGDEAIVGAAWDDNSNTDASGFGAVYIEPVQANPPCGWQAC
jgi:FG-GAP repeat